MAQPSDQPLDDLPAWKRRAAHQSGVKQAAALGYDRTNDSAPRVIAHGAGHIAERILAIAEEHHLPIRNDPTLVSILGALDVGAEVPPDLYGVIAEVLAWAYRTDQIAGSQQSRRRAA